MLVTSLVSELKVEKDCLACFEEYRIDEQADV